MTYANSDLNSFEITMCQDFISLYEGQELNAMQLQQRMMARWDKHVDWHLFSQILDLMYRQHLVKHKGFTKSGLTIYYIKERT